MNCTNSFQEQKLCILFDFILNDHTFAVVNYKEMDWLDNKASSHTSVYADTWQKAIFILYGSILPQYYTTVLKNLLFPYIAIHDNDSV